MKKILIFSMTYFPKPVGGAEVAIKEITDRIPKDDIEFHLVSLRFDSKVLRTEQFGAVTVHRIGYTRSGAEAEDFKKFPLHFNKALYQFSAVWHAWRLHRKHQFDGIWGMMAHSTAVPCGIFKTLFPKVGYVLTLQEGDPPEHIEKTMRVFGPLFRRGFTKADVVQSISTFLAAWGNRMGASRVLVIPNAVDTARFSQVNDQKRNQALTRLGKKKGDVFLITTSRHVEKNASDVTIRALARLPEQVHFAILGTGPLENQYRRLAEELGVSHRVHFLGHVENHEIPGYLWASDVFVRPSRSEGLGSSFIETMAAGIPIIATQEGGIADLLFDKKRNPGRAPTGYAVDKDSPEQIADAVKTIMANPQDVAQIVENARALALKEYDWDLIAQRMRKEVFAAMLT